MPDDTFSVAPMMEYTDRHLRYLLRLVSKRATLYTEMVRCSKSQNRYPAHQPDYN
jgi:tRNA-dihydrouridine synthase